MNWLWFGIGAWFVLSIPVAVIVGKALKRRSEWYDERF
jgi:hypothetical protein